MLFDRWFGAKGSVKPYWNQINSIKKKLRQAGQVDNARSVFGSSSHKYKMQDTATEQDVAKWEAIYGVRLPGDYAQFLTEIGNGGAGPYYGIYPLDKATGYSETEALVNPCILYPKMDKEEWSRLAEPLISDRDASDEEYDTAHAKIMGGMLCIGTRGCEYDMYLVLQGPHRGRVVYTSDFHEDFPFFFVYETNFLDWYERWLDEVIAGYDITWFGTKLPGDEKALIEAYKSANSDEEKLEALNSMLKFRTLSAAAIAFLKDVADRREADRDEAIQLICKTSLPAADSYLLEILQSGNSQKFLQGIKLLNWYGKSADADRYTEVIRREFEHYDEKEIVSRVGTFLRGHGRADIGDFQRFLLSSDPIIQRDALYDTQDCKNKAEHWEIIARMLEAGNTLTAQHYINY